MPLKRYVRVAADGTILSTSEALSTGEIDDAALLQPGGDGSYTLVLADGQPLPNPITERWDGAVWAPKPPPA